MQGRAQRTKRGAVSSIDESISFDEFFEHLVEATVFHGFHEQKHIAAAHPYEIECLHVLDEAARWIIWACVAARSPVARRVVGADVSPPASTPPRTPLSLYFPLLHTPHWYSLPVYRQLGIPPLQAQERTSRSLCSTADDTHDPVRLGSNKNSNSVTKC